MKVDPANAQELANIAQEIGANVLQGNVRYPSDTGGWQLGDLDLSEHLDRCIRFLMHNRKETVPGLRLTPTMNTVVRGQPWTVTFGQVIPRSPSTDGSTQMPFKTHR